MCQGNGDSMNPYVRIIEKNGYLYQEDVLLTAVKIIELLNTLAIEQNSWHSLDEWDMLEYNWEELTHHILLRLIGGG